MIMANTTMKSIPNIELLHGDTPIKENRNSLHCEIFDGVVLNVLVMISVLVTIAKKVCTVNISPVRCVNVLFCSFLSYNCVFL